MSPWTLACVLGGEEHKRAVAVCEMVGSLQLTPRLHLHTSHTRQLAESLACSLCVIMLGQSQGSPLTRRRQCPLLPFAARRTPLTARLLVGYSFPGWNRGNQLTLVLFVN